MVEITRIINANIELTLIDRADENRERVTAEEVKSVFENALKASGIDDVHLSNVVVKDFEMDVK